MARFAQFGKLMLNVNHVVAVHRMDDNTVIVILSNAHERENATARKGVRTSSAVDGTVHLSGADAEKAWTFFGTLRDDGPAAGT